MDVCIDNGERRPTRPAVLIFGMFALVAFACIACADARSWAQGRSGLVTMEGDNGSMLRLSVNDRAGMVTIADPNTGLGTVIPMPLSAFFALAREISDAPSRFPSIQVMDTQQTLLATPVTIKDGVGGVVMVKIARMSGSLGDSHPVLSVYAKRGDEKWDNEVRFSHARMDRLVSETGRLFTH